MILYQGRSNSWFPKVLSVYDDSYRFLRCFLYIMVFLMFSCYWSLCKGIQTFITRIIGIIKSKGTLTKSVQCPRTNSHAVRNTRASTLELSTIPGQQSSGHFTITYFMINRSPATMRDSHWRVMLSRELRVVCLDFWVNTIKLIAVLHIFFVHKREQNVIHQFNNNF